MSSKPGPDRADPFSLATYLVASARMVFEETPLYASMRLIEAAGRAADLAGGADKFLEALSAEIQTEKWGMIDDSEGFVAWVEMTLRRTVAEAKRRNVELYAVSDAVVPDGGQAKA